MIKRLLLSSILVICASPLFASGWFAGVTTASSSTFTGAPTFDDTFYLGTGADISTFTASGIDIDANVNIFNDTLSDSYCLHVGTDSSTYALVVTTNRYVGVNRSDPTEFLDIKLSNGASIRAKANGGSSSELEGTGTLVVDGSSGVLLSRLNSGKFYATADGVYTLSGVNTGINDATPDAQIDILSESGASEFVISAASQTDTTGSMLALMGDGKFGINDASPACFLNIGAGTADSYIAIGTVTAVPSAISNHAILYSTKAAGGDAELYGQDDGGNNKLLTPHNEKGEWIYYSFNTKTGKVMFVNMEEMIRDIQEYIGKQYLYNYRRDQ